MSCARPLRLALGVLFAFSVCSGLLAQQNSKQDASSQHPSNSDSTSLKISLRLADDAAFSGLSNLHVTSDQGAEVVGKATDSDGETIFSDLAPGNYSVEASAPGFISVKQMVEIKPRHGLRLYSW
jgi:hypothetical protein